MALLVCVCLLNAGSAEARPATLQEVSLAGLAGSIEILEDVQGAMSPAELSSSQRARFTPLRENSRWWGPSAKRYWMRFSLRNDAPREEDMLLQLRRSMLVSGLAMHVRAAGSEWSEQPIGRDSSGMQHRTMLVPLTFSPGQTLDVMMRFQASSPHLLDPQLFDWPEFLRFESRELSGIWLFNGFMALAFAAVVFISRAFRDPAYLSYGGMVWCTALTFLSLDGLGEQFLWQGSEYIQLRAWPLWCLAACFFSGFFCHHFLQLEGSPVRWTRGPRLGACVCGLAALLVPVLPVWAACTLVAILAPMTWIMVLGAAVLRWRGKFPQAGNFTLGILAIGVGTVLSAFDLLSLDSDVVGGLLAGRLGALLQVTLVSVAIARQISDLNAAYGESHTRELATRQEKLEAQQELLQLQESAARELHKQVEERTRDLRYKTGEAEQARVQAEEAYASEAHSRAEAEQVRSLVEVAFERLQKSDEAKTRFFQNISHELRTPLTLILNPLENCIQSGEGGERIEVALRNAKRLLRLVNQLLEFQKIAAGKRELLREPIELRHFLRLCADYFGPSCVARDLQFGMGGHLSENEAVFFPVHVSAETDALEKVVFNYLSNALKYTPAGGKVELSLESDEHWATIKVRDTGPGVPEDLQDELFSLFSAGNKGTEASEDEGTGLGLALVKELSEAMDGEVGVQSWDGDGSVFWVRFPRVVAPALQIEVDPSGGDINVGREWLLSVRAPGDEQMPSNAPQTDEADDTNLFAPADDEEIVEQILVVDDLRDMRDLIREAMTVEGYQVQEAGTADQALEMARCNRPDLIICDWMMPGRSGLDMAVELRADDLLGSVPVVMLTARWDEEGRMLGMEVGIDAFIGKPFDADELRACVRNLLALKKNEREVEALNRRLQEHVLKRYLPPDLVDSIVMGDQTITTEPKNATVTVMFTDLCGFTAATRRLGASLMSRLLNEYLAAMTRVVFEHGGTVDKFIGDAVMVLFGAPNEMSPSEQVRRASACAAAMQEALSELDARWHEDDPNLVELQMRIGIHQGAVVVGNFGSDKRVDYTAIGDSVNVASRIERACEPGAVFLSRESALQLPEVVTESVGSFELKGIEGKVPLFRLNLREARVLGQAA